LTAVYYEGSGQFVVGECDVRAPERGEVRLDVAFCGVCGTDIHIAKGHMDGRVRVPQVIGHEMSGKVADLGAGVEGFSIGDRVVVRPLDTRAESPADKGLSHISRGLRFMGIDSPGAFQRSWTVPAFTLHKLPRGVDLQLAALVEPTAVACHDVRRAALEAGETAVVIGCGPIGVLIALVARESGARVIVSEPNPYRRQLASSIGLGVVDPTTTDLRAFVDSETEGVGADVVFEVSGSPAGVEIMTKLACLRGRVVIVAIFPEPERVSLFDLFWKELTVMGARVYESTDYESAIELIASDALPLSALITAIEPLDRLPQVFDFLRGSPDALKVLVDCQS